MVATCSRVAMAHRDSVCVGEPEVSFPLKKIKTSPNVLGQARVGVHRRKTPKGAMWRRKGGWGVQSG